MGRKIHSRLELRQGSIFTPAMPEDLKKSSHVFAKNDAVRMPLQCPYDEPFTVKRRHEKFYVIERRGKEDTISIDRLKPAFLAADMPESKKAGPTTRSGRVAKTPNRLQVQFRS